jgi:hypothetical protein
MNSDIFLTITIPSMFAWFAWIIFSTIRRYKIAKLQAEVQYKLLDKVGTGQDLLAYAQTDAGKQLLELLKVERIAPYGRVLGALQAGIVFILLGIALIWLRSHLPGIPQDGSQFCTVFGALSIALGLGFALSAAASYYLSKSFGLFNGKRS